MWTWVASSLLVASFFLILVVLIVVNVKVNGEFKIETSWIAIALFPAVIWLITSGQLAQCSGFGLEFSLKQASDNRFTLDLDGDKINPTFKDVGVKGGAGKIPALINQRITALAFVLKNEKYNYDNEIIRAYLEQLTQHNFFKYAVFLNADTSFHGLMPARDLLKKMSQHDLAKEIKEGTIIDSLTGIVKDSVPETTSKRDALRKMNKRELSELPVVNETGGFVGIVERDKLTSSILLQLIARL